MLKTVSLAGVRCFRDRQEMDLGRLSLVYGPNNSGKSAVVRLLPWLSSSRAIGRPGLNLDAPALFGAGWRDMRWRGEMGPVSPVPPLAGEEGDGEDEIEVGLVDGSDRRWTWGLRMSTDLRAQQVRRFALADGDAVFTASLAPGRGAPRPYRLADGREMSITFDGLIPHAAGISDEAKRSLDAALSAVWWVTAGREFPARGGTPTSQSGALDPRGALTSSLLASDAELRRTVSAWFRLAAKLELDVEPLGHDLERLIVRPEGRASFDVPFSDVGMGLQQVLPVIAHLAAIERSGGTLVIEEPEANLHPELQRRVAKEIVRVLEAQPNAQVVVETHSQVLLLEALLAVVEKPALPVRLWWTEAGEDGASRVERVTLGDDGRPTSRLLERAFRVMGEVRLELAAARGAR